MTLLFRWLGVAGLEFRYNGQILLIDPFFTRPPLWCLWLGRVAPNRRLIAENIDGSDYILISHAHWDHMMDAPEIAAITGGLILGSPNTCRLAALSGLSQAQIHPIEAGKELSLGNFQVGILPGDHVPVPGHLPGTLSPKLKYPLRLRDYRMDFCFSFYVKIAGLRLLDWRGGNAKSAPQADVLFLGSEREAGCYKELLQTVQPSLVIPIHWDNFFRPLSKPLRPFYHPPRWAWPPLRRVNLEQFCHQIERLSAGTKVFLPELLHIYELKDIKGLAAQ